VQNGITYDFFITDKAMERMLNVSWEPFLHLMDRAFGFDAEHVKSVKHCDDMLY
jgi:hypothetical protein